MGATDQFRGGGGGNGGGNIGGSGGSRRIVSEINDALVLWKIQSLEATYEFLAGDTDRVETKGKFTFSIQYTLICVSLPYIPARLPWSYLSNMSWR